MTPETLLQQTERPLLIAHIAPDGDAIGSLLGLGWALREQGKSPTLACADPVPENLRFLPGAGDVVTRSRGDEDLVVALDCSDLQRLGSLYDGSATLPLLNIDHHVTNVGFGSVQLVEPDSASTAQIVYHLLQRLHWPLSNHVAACLLAGLVTDTRSFRTPNTGPDVLRTALALVEAGAPLAEINERLERGLTLGLIGLWGIALSRARLQDEVIWSEITLEDQRTCCASAADVTGLVSFLANVREAQVAILFTEREDGHIEVSLRSLPPVDVAAVALALGGGGHRQAAGCTLPGPLAAARAKVLAQVELALIPSPNGRGAG